MVLFVNFEYALTHYLSKVVFKVINVAQKELKVNSKGTRVTPIDVAVVLLFVNCKQMQHVDLVFLLITLNMYTLAHCDLVSRGVFRTPSNIYDGVFLRN